MVTEMDNLWLDLLNSDYHDHRGRGRSEDRLENQKWLASFLARWDLPHREVQAEDTRKALQGLRSLLLRIMTSLRAGERPRAKDIDVLNGHLSAAPLFRCVERDEGGFKVSLRAVESGLPAALAEIAGSFAEVLADGDPNRIKLCDNPDCRWVFYDQSKSRTRRWCDGGSCGNLLKVRRFRERKTRRAAEQPHSNDADSAGGEA
ncbi:MAG: CGNR zinc finger domain-containing protein [Phycisphaerales bacterium]|nr:MAG: CGNR zinc finger domain-containing protein [Phycisphaerales bacterium]